MAANLSRPQCVKQTTSTTLKNLIACTERDTPGVCQMNQMHWTFFFQLKFYPILSLRHWVGLCHDDVIKWRHFPRNWPFVRGIHQSLVNSPHKSQWRGALMFSLNCVWINGWVNNCKAGDLRRHHGHYDVNVMYMKNCPRHRHTCVLIKYLNLRSAVGNNYGISPLGCQYSVRQSRDKN